MKTKKEQAFFGKAAIVGTIAAYFICASITFAQAVPSYLYFDGTHNGTSLTNPVPYNSTSLSGTTFTSLNVYSIGLVYSEVGQNVYATEYNSGFSPGSTDVSTLGLTPGLWIFAGTGSGAYCFFTVLGDGSINTSSCQANSIPFGNISFPLPYATSSAAIAASSSLWESLQVASSSISCSTGNFFTDGLCSAGAFLFVPNPNILNQYVGLPSALQSKFPFSWVYAVQTTVGSLSASSTANFGALSFGLGDLGIGSTTPMGNILPNVDVFSTTTLMKYMPIGVWNTGQSLIAISLWLGLIYFIFHDARRRFQGV